MTQDETVTKFLGQLIFQGKELNEVGSLHTEEDMSHFGVLLNQSLGLPVYWTLEILAKSLFDNVKPLFANLKAINLTVVGSEHRIAEYSIDEEPNNSDIIDAVELPYTVG